MQPPGRGHATAARTGARHRRQLLMAAGGQIPTTANTEDRRKIKQPGESRMLAEPCRGALTESSRWISR
jgi:hypothetical protein